MNETGPSDSGTLDLATVKERSITMPFEPDNAPYIFGSIQTTITEGLVGAQTPSTVINLGQPWSVNVTLRVEGNGARNNPAESGEWNARVFVESFGPGFDGQVGSLDFPVTDAPVQAGPPRFREYQKTIPIPAAAVPAAGVYKIITILTARNPAGAAGTPEPFAAFDESHVVQFF
jgi:hypothetical protein